MSAAYEAVRAALGRVGVATGEVASVGPSYYGCAYARLGNRLTRAATPEQAVQALLRELADICRSYRLAPLKDDAAVEERHRTLDAMAEAYEAVGGRWWEVGA